MISLNARLFAVIGRRRSSFFRVKDLFGRGEGGVGARFIAPWGGPLCLPAFPLKAGETIDVRGVAGHD